MSSDEGRVDTLLIKPDAEQRGRVDFANLNVEIAHDDGGTDVDSDTVDLLDYAASRTLANGGEVFAVAQIPGSDSPLAAILRW